MNRSNPIALIGMVVQRGFSGFLLGAFALGLALPPLQPPTALVPGLLATVLFVACARITPSDLRHVAPGRLLAFYVVRFALLPVLLWALCSVLAPPFALPVLLLAMLPTGVTASAITAILGGNPALALGATALSTALAPVAIPLGLALLGDSQVDIDLAGIGTTLFGLLFLPTASWFGVARHHPPTVRRLQEHGGVVSVVLICTIALLVANGQQARILEAPLDLAGLFAAGLLLYGVFYGLGLAWARGGAHRERVSWSIASGNDNIVLGVTLTLLHLPDAVVPLVAWDLAWIVGLSGIQPVLHAMERAGGEHDPCPDV